MKFPRALFWTAHLASQGINALLSPLGYQLSRRTPPLRTTADLIRDLFAGETDAFVIDVGAAEGNFSAEILRTVPAAQIICVEPVPECQRALERRFARSKVTIIPAALGERDGMALFHETSGRDSSSVLPMGRHREEFPLVSREVASYQIKLSRLDTVLDREPRSAVVDLLKIDVQGYERQVLEGAERTLQRCRFVLVELSLKPLYEGQAAFEEVLLLLNRSGFRIRDYVEGIRGQATAELLQMDFLFSRSADVPPAPGART